MAVSVLLIRGLVEQLEQVGITREKFLESAEFDVRRLEQSDGRASSQEYQALQELALDLSGDAALGLHMGEFASATTYSLAAHLVGHAITLRDGIETLIKFHGLLMDRRMWQLLEAGATATLVYQVPESSARCKRFNAEMTMTGFLRMVRHFVRDARPESVTFEHPAPAYASEYRRIFEGAERFDHPFTGLVFDRELLGASQLHSDADFHGALKEQAEKRLSRMTHRLSFTERVRDYLLERATPDRRDMDAAARALGISSRSLRRRLAEEGSSYSAIVEEALAIMAKRLLSDEESSIEAIAYTMGFSDPSAFYRAFKRWTGTTPKEYRSCRHSSDAV